MNESRATSVFRGRYKMSIESAIEGMIREAIARGDFDNLEGKGKPLDLSAYFNTPEDVRMGYSVLKANNFVPEEVELLQEIADLKEKIAATPAGEDHDALKKLLQGKMLKLTLIFEKNKRKIS